MRAKIQNEIRKQTRALFVFVWDAWRPKVKRKPSIWSVEERFLAAGDHTLGSEDLRFDHDLMPHCIEQMDAADDPKINTIVIWEGIRDGKTGNVCMNVIGRAVTDDPGGIYSVHPIQDDCDRFDATTLEPTIKATPALDSVFVEAKSRDAGRTKEFKKFAGGWIRIVSAGSITKFRGTSVKVLLLHELDALNPESIYAALNRTTGFADAIRILESTGTYAAEIDDTGKKIYHSRIHEWYEKGDMRKWFCSCRGCGRLQTTKFDQIKKLESKSGGHYFYICEFCDRDHNEKQWRKFSAEGLWLPTAGLTLDQEREIERTHKQAKAKDPTVRSYWRNGFANLLPTGKGYDSKLHQFVVEEDRSKSSPEARQKWINEIAAELWSLQEEDEPPPQWRPIYDARKDYTVIPAQGLIVTGMVDVHSNRLEIYWKAFSKNGEGWAVKHSVIDGSHRSLDTWLELARRLKQGFVHESGHTLPLSMAFIDCGWASEWVAALWFGNVYRRAENQSLVGKVRASKGIGAPNLRIIAKRWAPIGNGIKGVHIGTWEAKDTVYSRLRELSEAKCPMHYCKDFEEDWFQQLTAEAMVLKFLKGRMVRTYENPKSLRNEALDLEVGCLAAFLFRKWDFEAMEARLKISEVEKPEPKKKPEPEEQHGRSWVRVAGWK